MEELSGYIKHIIFSNRDNGYTVFELDTDTECITCVGALVGLCEGERVRLTGEYVTHSVYGRQFSFKGYEQETGRDELSVYRYLASGAVKGIGPATAKKIIEAFGEDTFRIMEEECELLATIKGISLNKARDIGARFGEKQDLRRIMVFLQKFGISVNLANKIYEKYGLETYRVMEENPYRLAEDIEGVGFKTADDIAISSGVDASSPYRIRSGILYAMSLAVSEGHIYLPKEEAVAYASRILGIDEDAVFSECERLGIESRLVIKQAGSEVRIYLPSFYRMETACARMIRDLDLVRDKDAAQIYETVRSLEDPERPLAEKQREAVVGALSNGLFIITGGPGTGKTTIINVLIKYLAAAGEEFVLAAPTGRAAKRMTEATGYESSTIQRLLGLSPGGPDGNAFSYEYNEDNPLEADAVIIDEMSMVDLPLFKSLLSAIVPGTRLIMVGDTNQLPSVGPGSVLRDLIRSECIGVARLDRIFRQSDESDIIENAHKINAGLMPRLDNKSRDFFMLRRDNANIILSNIITLVSKKLPGYVGARPFDIQVLTPTRKGPLGVENLNPVLQKYLNPPAPEKKEKEYGSTLFREGDKVMQIRNDYQLEWEIRGSFGISYQTGTGVFNGDLGKIDRIDTFSEVMEVVYEDDRRVRYPFSQLDELELAYAVTIHKSQGSEYPAVVIPLLWGPRQLFNRNLLYTAITRAVKCVTIVGSEETVEYMVENEAELKRYTSLAQAIKENIY